MTTEEFIKEYKEELKNPTIQKPAPPRVWSFFIKRIVPVAIVFTMVALMFYWFSSVI